MILEDFWNAYNSQKVPEHKVNRKCGNNTKRIISDNENKKMISRKASRMAK